MFTTHRHSSLTARHYEHGITLVVSLLFLLLLTILGITAMNTSGLQEKMAGNLRDQDTALHAAESALRGGEDQMKILWISGRPNSSSDSTCSTDVCAKDSVDPLNDTTWNNMSRDYGGSGSQIAQLGGAAIDPRYAIEELATIADSQGVGSYGRNLQSTQFYKIISRASGTTTLSMVVTEETFRIRYAP